jgi:spermidine/putrescine transport system ATP-binding protein
MPDPIIELKDLVLTYDGVNVVDHIDLKIYPNEFITFLGPSGCGKTSTLRMIGGHERATSGEIIIDGKIFNNIPPYARPLNTVFQKYALFPNMNVIQNVMVGLKSRPFSYLYEFFGGKEQLIKELNEKGKKVNIFTLNKLINEKIEEEAKKALALVKLNGFEKRSIDQMSGGQQQRCAIARAIVNKPKILLLDEPLAALDLKLRENMQYELKEMQRKLGITFIFVTHDQTEAMTMSDRIVVMADGHIQQIGTPKETYNTPVNKFVANFVGESNIMPGVYHLKDGKASISFFDQEFPMDVYPGFVDGEACNVVIRPEDWDVIPASKAKFKLKVSTCIFKGVAYEICGMYEGKEIVIHAYIEAKPGSEIGLTVDPYEVHIMKAE